MHRLGSLHLVSMNTYMNWGKSTLLRVIVGSGKEILNTFSYTVNGFMWRGLHYFRVYRLTLTPSSAIYLIKQKQMLLLNGPKPDNDTPNRIAHAIQHFIQLMWRFASWA